MAKAKKNLMEKMVDAVDHVLHPLAGEDHGEEIMQVKDKSSLQETDFANHPKFDKFKTSSTGEKLP